MNLGIALGTERGGASICLPAPPALTVPCPEGEQVPSQGAEEGGEISLE